MNAARIELMAHCGTLLGHMRRAPGMYAITQEAFLARLCGTLDAVCPDLRAGPFYARHLGTRGSVYSGALRRVRDDWARAACDDAFRIMLEENR